MSKSVLPAAPDAEKAVVASVLGTGGLALFKLEFLKPEMFFVYEHRLVYETALGIWKGGGRPDFITVAEALKDSGTPNAKELLDSFREKGSSIDGVEDYGKLIAGKWLSRAIHDVGAGAAERSLEEDPFALLDDVERTLAALRPQRGTGFQALMALQPVTMPEEPNTILSGFELLDKKLGGLVPGRLIVVAARPGIGKTTLGQNIAAHVASQGKVVGFISLEMSSDELNERFISSDSQVPMGKWRKQNLDEGDLYNIGRALYRMGKWNLHIDQTSGLSVAEITARARRLKVEHGLDFLVVDYIQLIRGGSRFEKKNDEIAHITGRLKQLARELDVPILALSQMNREIERRSREGENPEPQLADLRDGGSIEQDADHVIFLWRKKEGNTGDYIITNGKVEKNRHGTTGPFVMGLRAHCATFEGI
jgi:replicative DNA helicase